uniref:Uncharacterized protein n=1 Tax=Arundo donax TaxID=35708 RepID=A0A0A8Z3H6_ARUDO
MFNNDNYLTPARCAEFWLVF